MKSTSNKSLSVSPEVQPSTIQPSQYINIWQDCQLYCWKVDTTVWIVGSLPQRPDLQSSEPNLQLIDGKKARQARQARPNTIQASWRKYKINISQAQPGWAGINGTNWTMKVCWLECSSSSLFYFFPWEAETKISMPTNKRKVLSFYLNVQLPS